ncbi:MAG: BsuPI-related putative proteinase inhibitor [Gammaproteobacteria bacterium]|nr:BsuPI-related putative proteinase inhibitor [Gammaproteobacteria bacterium]
MINKQIVIVMFLLFSIIACYDDTYDDMTQANFTLSILTKDSFGQVNDTFLQGEPITIEMMVSNPTSKKIDLRFSSGCQYSFKLYNSNNEAVWDWLADKLCTQAITYLTIPANGSELIIVEQDGTINPDSRPVGDYKLTGYLIGYDRIAEMTITIQ